MNSVFITDGQLRKSLSATRSLGKKGIEVWVGEKTIFSPATFSKYCSRAVRYPDPGKYPEQFYQWLLDFLQTHSIDILFPMDDEILQIVMNHRNELEKYCRLPLPPLESYQIASDKYETMKLAQRTGVPCPATVVPPLIEHIEQSVSGLSFPLVIKPKKSSGSRGVRIVNNLEELRLKYEEVHRQYPYPLIQEFIPTGDRFDVCLLYDKNNQIVARFVQKELRHFPVETGPSTAQESVRSPELLNLGLQLMKPLPWQGVVEIEFMIDPRDGIPKLMEINPRFWNSLELAVQAGVDFPYLLYQIAGGEDVEPVEDYPSGKRCRSLLPGDILHFLFNKNRFRLEPPFFSGKVRGGEDDILSINDPWPTLGFLLAVLRYIFSPQAWKWLFKR